MRGGAFLKGKEGRVGFRRSLKVQGRTGGFSKDPSLMGKSGANERNESSLSNCRVQPALSKKEGLVGFRKTLKVQGSTGGFSKVQEFTFIFLNVNKVLVGFRKTSLNAKEVFRKPFLSPIS